MSVKTNIGPGDVAGILDFALRGPAPERKGSSIIEGRKQVKAALAEAYGDDVAETIFPKGMIDGSGFVRLAAFLRKQPMASAPSGTTTANRSDEQDQTEPPSDAEIYAQFDSIPCGTKRGAFYKSHEEQICRHLATGKATVGGTSKLR